ncbi:hypothetical protein L211DRAFT_842388 [Terfezia boudieri ATCC MYA-4762]|uniref:Uncharacterized protein n=1 Tax=Terfezia boudieri ATCC MYA-4762 TaxID=1051890 RepID=A0A3N4LDX9_9PEZI|nr:hypothetical protein L211DRAFT_842388 [Terfezia boudieri ATCC MYA-4762]
MEPKKRPDYYLAFFITLSALCILFTVIWIVDWIITTEREKASFLAYGQKFGTASLDSLQPTATTDVECGNPRGIGKMH